MQGFDKRLFDEMMDAFDDGYDLAFRYHSSRHWYGEEFVYPSEAHMIRAVGGDQGITSNTISRDTPKSRSAYSQIVKKLRQKGYIEQITNQEDRREQLIYLTEKGKRLYSAHNQVNDFYINRTYQMMSELSEEEIRSYIRVQKIMNRAFELDVQDGERVIREHEKKKED